MVAATVSPNTKDFLHQRQGATDSVFDFYKQEIFTYPLSNKFHLICLPVSNLSSSQSVVWCVYGKCICSITKYDPIFDLEITVTLTLFHGSVIVP